MADRPIPKRGSFWRRFSIVSLSVLLTIFVFWLLGFLVDDIGNLPGPDRAEIEARHVDATLGGQIEAVQRRIADLDRQVREEREVQQILNASMAQSRSAMDLLVGLNRLSLEQGVTPTEEEQLAMAESQRLFLAKQTEFQQVNERIAGLAASQRGAGAELRGLTDRRAEQLVPANEEFARLARRHGVLVGWLKVGLVSPLLLGAAWLTMRQRRRPFAPIAYALLAAAFWRVAIVMHQWFPTEWVKYIATAAGIAAILAFMIQIIRAAVKPKLDWLLAQYRDAYNRRRCPICAHPIRRGPFKHVEWSRKGPKGFATMPTEAGAAPDEPYACPSCGTALYEKCGECGAVRHSLLPYCEACGAKKAIGDETAPTPTPEASTN
jgi:hypothetical protein